MRVLSLHRFARRRARCPLVLALLLAPVLASAETAETPVAVDSAAPALWVRAQGGQRLSESWLQTRRPGVAGEDSATGYALGLMWIAPAARPAQRVQLRVLLGELQRVADREPQRRAELLSLRQELASMPVTGRVPLPAQDLYWLQANPAYDPVLADGDEWWLPTHPSIVRVWISSGERCDLPFRPQALAAHYIGLCASSAAASGALADEVLLVQPDARVHTIGIAPWNAQLQAPPAPGAWIWAARRDSGLTAGQQAALGAWLATQGPAGAATVPSAEPLVTAVRTPVPPASEVRPLPAESAPARELSLRASDWGVTGLLQTPTARTRPAGTFGMTIGRTVPYTHVNLLLSPFDRLEVVVRYSNLGSLLYGPEIAGDQSYKDKSAEVKLRLFDESSWTPAVALGLRDPGGTGFFGSEYLVASKRWGDLDLSLGLGWGYAGARGDLGNPFSALGLRPAQRQATQVGNGGTASLSTLFSGRTALFGGVQWRTPWQDLVLKLEWDGNDYRHEPGATRLDATSSVQAGLSWRWGDAELGLSWQRGNQWSLSLAWLGSLPAIHAPKLSVPRMPSIDEPARAVSMAVPPAGSSLGESVATGAQAAVPAVPAEAATAQVGVLFAPVPDSTEAAASPGDRQAELTHAILVELAEHTGWHATRLERSADRWTAWFDHAGGAYQQERIERVWAVMHREAPPGVKQLAIELASRQLPMARHEIDREAWAGARSRYQARHQQPAQGAPDGSSPVREPSTPFAWTPSPEDTPRVATGVNLAFQQHLGGPDGYLYALSARAFGQVRAWSGAWLQGSVNLRLLDNYDRFRYTAPSELPRVRTHLREYVTARNLTIPNLQFTQAARLAEGVYGMVYAGYLEPMFAGVGGELLWRPLNSRWAVGLDLNLVRKRNFEQDLGLQDYQVKTGHVTARWDTGWQDVVVGASAGQYLAGDRGVTVDVARVFSNGTRMGVWATRTNVSAAQFGEGSFDKGLYVSVPFDAMFTSWSGSALTVAWQPLIRDGGAKLQRGASLWGLTDARDARVLEFRSATPDAGSE